MEAVLGWQAKFIRLRKEIEPICTHRGTTAAAVSSVSRVVRRCFPTGTSLSSIAHPPSSLISHPLSRHDDLSTFGREPQYALHGANVNANPRQIVVLQRYQLSLVQPSLLLCYSFLLDAHSVHETHQAIVFQYATE